MPRRILMVRRGSLLLGTLFIVAAVASVTAVVVRALAPAPVFAPLSLSDHYELANGTGRPPQIRSGAPLAFTPFVWCNNTQTDLQAHVSLSFANLEQPPLQTVTAATLVPLAVPKGCGQGPGSRALTPPEPLQPGHWQAVLTVSVAINGRIQILTRISEPFVVVP